MRESVLIVAALLVVACSVPALPSPGNLEPSISAPVTLPPSPVPSSGVLPSATASLDDRAPVEAAVRLLDLRGARVSFELARAKGSDPAEILVTALGVLDPAGDRGRMIYDYTVMMTIPGAPTESPDPYEAIEVRWDRDDFYASAPVGDEASDWSRMPLNEAAIRGGLIGRLPGEIRGLVALVADAAPATVARLPSAVLDGRPAERFLVRVPIEKAVLESVPGDAPHVDAFRTAFGLDAVPVEVWLVDGQLRRIGYVLEREKAPYGGPDRTSVIYSWSSMGVAVDIEIPPPGTIVDR